MKKTLIVFFVVLIFIYASLLNFAFSQDAQKEVLNVSLKDVIQMALKASEDMRIMRNEVLRQKSQFLEEKANFHPRISGAVTWSNDYHHPDGIANPPTKKYALDAGLSIDQTLFTFGRLESALEAARKEIEASQWDEQTTEREIIYLAKVAYYNAYLAKQTFAIAQSSYERASQNKDILHERSSGGRASKHDNIKVAADLASRLPSVSNARASLSAALQTLKTIIGFGYQDDIAIVDDCSVQYRTIDCAQIIAQLRDQHPALKSLSMAVAAYDDTVREKKRAFFPELAAFSTWHHNGVGNDADVDSDSMHNYGVIGLKLDVPIWDGGERVEALEQAKIDRSNAALTLQKTDKELSLELTTAIIEYNEFIATLSANEEAVRLAQESFQMSQDLFRSGQISVTDLNDAELFLTQEKLKEESTRFNINVTLAQIEKLSAAEIRNE